MIPICRKSRIVAGSSFVESRSSSKKSAIAKNAPLILKRNRMKESGGGSAPNATSWNIHPTVAIPHVAQPKPTSNQRDLFRPRSEEHTSELQSPCKLVFRLLLEKKTY